MADQVSALPQWSDVPGSFKGRWEAFMASGVTLARSCIALCPAQHSCRSCHFLPLTTRLWLGAASARCTSQMSDVKDVLACKGFYWMLWICTGARGFLLCVTRGCLVGLFYFCFHPPAAPLSQKHSVAEVGRDLWRPSGATPCSSRATQDPVSSTCNAELNITQQYV